MIGKKKNILVIQVYPFVVSYKFIRCSNSGSEREIGEMNLNPGRVHYDHFCTNSLEKDQELPPALG